MKKLSDGLAKRSKVLDRVVFLELDAERPPFLHSFMSAQPAFYACTHE